MELKKRNISKYPFIPKEKVSENDEVVFLDEGKWSEAGKYGSQVQISVLWNEVKFTCNINATSEKNLTEAWGYDTKLWKGKIARIEKDSQRIDGERRIILYLFPTNKEKDIKGLEENDIETTEEFVSE